MKKNFKKVLIPGLTAIAFGAISIGTTFALFTDEAKTNVEMQAGIVDVDQTLAIVSVSELYGVAVPAVEGVYTNTVGSKTYIDAQDSSVLHLEKWVPGDKAVVTLQNKNESNVSIKTRFAESHTSTSTPDLYDALKITYAFAGGYDAAITEENFQEWVKVGVPQGENKVLSTLTITIEFEDHDEGEIVQGAGNKDNKYQDANCAISFVQEALQGNAHTPDTSKGYADSYEEEIGGVTYEVNELAEPEHFEKMLQDLETVDPTDAEEVEEAKKTIYKLDADIDLEGSAEVNQGILYGTLDGQGHKISNVEYEAETAEEKKGAGIFAEYFDGAVVKNLEVENINISGEENVGVLFGRSYSHASGHTGGAIPGSELIIENVTIGSNVKVSGTKGVGGIAGSTRYVEKLVVRNCVNNADVSAETYNVGGFFGSLTSVEEAVIENCINNGNIRGPHYVAGFFGGSADLEKVTMTNCENHGNIIDFSYRAITGGGQAYAGWFLAGCKSNAVLNYSGNINDGNIYYVSSNVNYLNVFEKDLVGDTDAAGIKVAAGKTYQDYMILDDSIVLNMSIENNQFVVSPVASAHHYTISMQVWGRDVRLEGNTAVVYKEKYLSTTATYTNVQDLHDNFGRITRAGYFLNSIYTQYDYVPLSEGGVSQSSTMNGRANFFRLPYAQKAAYAELYQFNKPSYDATLGEWVFILDGEAGCLPGTGLIMSPKNTSVSYIITAYDANDHVIANGTHYDNALGMNPGDATDVSGSFLKNMAGDVFWSASPGTETGDKVYAPVA